MRDRLIETMKVGVGTLSWANRFQRLARKTRKFGENQNFCLRGLVLPEDSFSAEPFGSDPASESPCWLAGGAVQRAGLLLENPSGGFPVSGQEGIPFGLTLS